MFENSFLLNGFYNIQGFFDKLNRFCVAWFRTHSWYMVERLVWIRYESSIDILTMNSYATLQYISLKLGLPIRSIFPCNEKSVRSRRPLWTKIALHFDVEDYMAKLVHLVASNASNKIDKLTTPLAALRSVPRVPRRHYEYAKRFRDTDKTYIVVLACLL